MTDTFENFPITPDSFGYDAEAVTPSDTTDLDEFGRFIYIGTTGNVRIMTMKGNAVTFANHPVGYMPMRVRRVYATGTTASNIVSIV